MFDKIKCKYPLPVKGANKFLYQTKDTEAQFFNLYEIRKDGTLWHEAYDIEDKSNPNAKGIMKLVGCMTKVNKKWEQVEKTGEIKFYRTIDKNHDKWLEFSAYFVKGKLNQIHKL